MQLRSLQLDSCSFQPCSLAAFSFQLSVFSFQLRPWQCSFGLHLGSLLLGEQLAAWGALPSELSGSLLQLMGKASSFHSRLWSLEACSEQLGAINLQL